MDLNIKVGFNYLSSACEPVYVKCPIQYPINTDVLFDIRSTFSKTIISYLKIISLFLHYENRRFRPANYGDAPE